jgi:tRNA(adenine34) deaminase
MNGTNGWSEMNEMSGMNGLNGMNDDIMREHERWMREAMAEARQAEQKGEVPIGAVVVRNGVIVGRGHNLRETSLDGTAHAEIIAIRDACSRLEAWRLLDCDLYVTLEPCPMCAGAIVQSRIRKVVFGAYDPKAGCAGTLMNLLQEPKFNHRTEVVGGVLERECGDMLSQFFRKLRQKPHSLTDANT